MEQVDPPNEEDLVEPEGDPYGDREERKPKEEAKSEKDTAIRQTIEAKAPRDKAFVEDQVRKYPDFVKLDRVQVKVLDLAVEEEVEAYSEIKTQSANPDLGLTIGYEEIQWSKDSNNWKVLLHLNHYKFLPIV